MKLGREYSCECHGLNLRGEMVIDRVIFYCIGVLNSQN